MSLRVILYGNRVCNGTVTLAQNKFPAGHFGGGRAYGIATDNFAVETDNLYSDNTGVFRLGAKSW